MSALAGNPSLLAENQRAVGWRRATPSQLLCVPDSQLECVPRVVVAHMYSASASTSSFVSPTCTRGKAAKIKAEGKAAGWARVPLDRCTAGSTVRNSQLTRHSQPCPILDTILPSTSTLADFTRCITARIAVTRNGLRVLPRPAAVVQQECLVCSRGCEEGAEMFRRGIVRVGVCCVLFIASFSLERRSL